MKKQCFILWVVYLLMLVLYAFFNGFRFTGISIENLIVNGIFFVLVFIIFVRVTIRIMMLSAVDGDLKAALKRFKKDYAEQKAYLWDHYQEKNLFKTRPLSSAYEEFKLETKRLEAASNSEFQCDIEDFINHELLETVVNKSLCSIVPGLMTGLGILGTFIGLSFGLREFNTGTSEEIMGSITPLMEGLKIAFHTSIFGMVFSLVFNYIYKSCTHTADQDLIRFLDAFRKYVCPMSNDDATGRLLTYQHQQEKIQKKLLSVYTNSQKEALTVKDFEAFRDSMTESVSKAMEAHYEKLDQLYLDFANVSADRQAESLKVITDAFVSQMQEALGASFARLGEELNAISSNQQQNDLYLRSLLDEINGMLENARQMNIESASILEHISGYFNSLNDMEAMLASHMNELNQGLRSCTQIQLEQSNYLEMLVSYQRQMITDSDLLQKKCVEAINLMKVQSDAVQKESEAGIAQLQTYSKEQLETIFENVDARMSEFCESLNAYAKELKKNASQKKRGLFG